MMTVMDGGTSANCGGLCLCTGHRQQGHHGSRGQIPKARLAQAPHAGWRSLASQRPLPGGGATGEVSEPHTIHHHSEALSPTSVLTERHAKGVWFLSTRSLSRAFVFPSSENSKGLEWLGHDGGH